MVRGLNQVQHVDKLVVSRGILYIIQEYAKAKEMLK
jgi:hypothetical protein